MSFSKPVAPVARKRRQATYTAMMADTDTDKIRENLETIFADVGGTGPMFYGIAQSHIQDMSDATGYSFEICCAVVVVLSPTTEWERNLQLAWDMLETGDCNHRSGDAIRKARRIRDGESPSAVLGGRKVRSFLPNCAEPYRNGPVTLDRHMITAARDHGMSAARLQEILWYGVKGMETINLRGWTQ